MVGFSDDDLSLLEEWAGEYTQRSSDVDGQQRKAQQIYTTLEHVIFNQEGFTSLADLDAKIWQKYPKLLNFLLTVQLTEIKSDYPTLHTQLEDLRSLPARLNRLNARANTYLTTKNSEEYTTILTTLNELLAQPNTQHVLSDIVNYPSLGTLMLQLDTSAVPDAYPSIAKNARLLRVTCLEKLLGICISSLDSCKQNGIEAIIDQLLKVVNKFNADSTPKGKAAFARITLECLMHIRDNIFQSTESSDFYRAFLQRPELVTFFQELEQMHFPEHPDKECHLLYQLHLPERPATETLLRVATQQEEMAAEALPQAPHDSAIDPLQELENTAKRIIHFSLTGEKLNAELAKITLPQDADVLEKLDRAKHPALYHLILNAQDESFKENILSPIQDKLIVKRNKLKLTESRHTDDCHNKFVSTMKPGESQQTHLAFTEQDSEYLMKILDVILDNPLAEERKKSRAEFRHFFIEEDPQHRRKSRLHEVLEKHALVVTTAQYLLLCELLSPNPTLVTSALQEKLRSHLHIIADDAENARTQLLQATLLDWHVANRRQCTASFEQKSHFEEAKQLAHEILSDTVAIKQGNTDNQAKYNGIIEKQRKMECSSARTHRSKCTWLNLFKYAFVHIFRPTNTVKTFRKIRQRIEPTLKQLGEQHQLIPSMKV